MTKPKSPTPAVADIEALEGLDSYRQQLIEQLKLKIKSLPDNPRIQRVGGAGRGFVMSSADLTSSLQLSPEMYDFKAQYEDICRILEKTNPDRVRVVLMDIVIVGVHQIPGRRVHFHPDVRRELQGGGLVAAIQLPWSCFGIRH